MTDEQLKDAPAPPADEPGLPAPPNTAPARLHPRPRVLGGQTLRREARIHRDDRPAVDDDLPIRPVRRADCEHGVRPCPWVGCKHNLYLSVDPATGSITISFPDLEPDEMEDSCALDVAERGGLPLERIGEMMNLTRERIRQLETRAIEVMRRVMARAPIATATRSP